MEKTNKPTFHKIIERAKEHEQEQRERDLIHYREQVGACQIALASVAVHHHKRTLPDADMGPTCGAECAFCGRLFSPESVEENIGVRYMDDQGWVCRGCAAIELLHEVRAAGLEAMRGKDWP